MRSRFARLAVVVSLFLIAGFSTGCASILGGSSHKIISFDSNPSGANITVLNKNNEEVAHGVTPFKADLKRGWKWFVPANYTVKCDFGSEHQETQIDSHINPWYFGNIAFGGLLGMVFIDPLTGAMWDPKSDIYFKLNEGPAVAPVAGSTPLNAPAYAANPSLDAPNPAGLPAIYKPLPPDSQ